MKHLLILATLALAACGSTSHRETQTTAEVKQYIQRSLDALHAASVALKTAAPDHAWSASSDAAAIATMKAEWKKARIAYESIEGAIAVLFPELDVSTDERYDGFLAEKADPELFDGEGVTGVHAIERILYADSIPPQVVNFESGLTGYQAAAFPADTTQAQDFKNKLCARLVADIDAMRSQFTPLALDASTAFRGVIGSMGEQIEKLEKSATGEEESRYAQFTLEDMRTNVAAGVATFNLFVPWLEDAGGTAQRDAVKAAFARVDTAYARLPGEALPPVPTTWSSAHPSQADLATDFGKLYSALQAEADPTAPSSLVAQMNACADLLKIPQLPQ
ncbi:MAG: EfeM/EfeO family lipoprotein [Myxococcaceae bacterium]|nr:EfeM/EfeO family lipoprotein [Myxococcaceae bacterium]